MGSSMGHVRNLDLSDLFLDIYHFYMKALLIFDPYFHFFVYFFSFLWCGKIVGIHGEKRHGLLSGPLPVGFPTNCLWELRFGKEADLKTWNFLPSWYVFYCPLILSLLLLVFRMKRLLQGVPFEKQSFWNGLEKCKQIWQNCKQKWFQTHFGSPSH